jgi:hypothetical protein
MTISRIASAIGAAAVLAASAGAALAQGDKNVLRLVPHSNLSILDPVWTTAYMSRNHAYMIYDTLFGTDENDKVKPQMVESWTESPDHRLWSFKLRKGLEFHDGKPVTGEDVIASLQRWGKRDAMGIALMTFVDRMDSPTPDTFRIFMREACGFMLEAIGKPSSNWPVIMPKRVAETDAFKQIDDYTGSGPYVFKKDEFKPGDKAVYVRNPKYVPRSEPPSGTAGGKHAYIERVEFNLALRDAQAQVIALQKGEVDIIEALAFEHYETVKKDPNLVVPKIANRGLQHMARFNHLLKPFDNPAVRRAAIAAFNQEAFLKAQVGVKELYKTCPSMFICGTPVREHSRERHPGEVEHEEGAGVAQGLGLRRHAGRDHEADRPGHDHEAARRGDATAAAGRVQGRSSGDGLADAGRPPREEGSGRQGRLEHVPHRLAGGGHLQPDQHGGARGEGREVGLVRLADGREDGELRAQIHARDRRRQEKEACRSDPGPGVRDRHACSARRVFNVTVGRKNISGWFVTNSNIYWGLKKN